MGLFSKPIKTLEDLYVHMLQDMYYAEQQIAKNLPTMIEKAAEPQLKQGLTMHLEETRNQAKRLERVFEMLGIAAKGVTCAAMDGILAEAKEVLGDVSDQDVIDVAIIASSQAIEHYEITRYGTLVAFAKELGRQDCAAVLQQSLDEEHAADRKLTAVAESRVNRKAVA